MGDVMTLVEKAERQMDERQAQELEKKIRKEQFTLDDYRADAAGAQHGPARLAAQDDAGDRQPDWAI